MTRCHRVIGTSSQRDFLVIGTSPLATSGMIEPMMVGARRDNMVQGRVCLSQAVERPLLLQTVCSGTAL